MSEVDTELARLRAAGQAGSAATMSAAEIIRELVAKREAADADKRRVAIARLTEQDIFTFLDLPEGFEMVGVHADWARMSIEVMVRSKTLDPVTPGAIPPDVAGSWSREVYLEEYVAEGHERFVSRRPWYRMGWSPEVSRVDEHLLANGMSPERLDEIKASAAEFVQVTGEPVMSAMAAQLANYLKVREHTLSTAALMGDAQLLAEAVYVLGEARELHDAVEALTRSNMDGLSRCREHVRHEIADVALSNAALATMFNVTVEDCIAEKTEADRGRG